MLGFAFDPSIRHGLEQRVGNSRCKGYIENMKYVVAAACTGSALLGPHTLAAEMDPESRATSSGTQIVAEANTEASGNIDNQGADSQIVEKKLSEIKVTATRDKQKKYEVYTAPRSSIYMDREDFERYKGNQLGDVFRGQVGVFNGDTRNGGLNPNIRGIMGEGRVAVTVDGAENGMTKNKGFYTGSGYSSYIDPNLIASGTILKGPQINRETKTAPGGVVALRTIGPRDILKDGKTSGIWLRLDANNNTTRPRMPSYGVSYGDRMSAPHTFNENIELRKKDYVKTRSSGPWNNFRDGSTLAALAWRNEHLALMSAFSYRRIGNYYSGRHGVSSAYGEGLLWKDHVIESWARANYRFPVLKTMPPGHEVTNTSSHNKTWLLKAELTPDPDQMLALTLRNTKIGQGGVKSVGVQSVYNSFRYADGQYLPQLPEAHVDERAYNLEYHWNPADLPALDIQANVWQTTTKHLDYNAPFGGVMEWRAVPDSPLIDGKREHEIVNSLMMREQSKRKGYNLSNQFDITPTLKLLTGTNIENHDIKPLKNHWKSERISRSGKIQNNRFYANLNWKPTDWLDLNIGGERTAFKSRDRAWRARMANENDYLVKDRNKKKLIGYLAGGATLTDEAADRLINANPENFVLSSGYHPPEGYKSVLFYWMLRDDGKLHAEDNPFLTGVAHIDRSEYPSTYSEWDINRRWMIVEDIFETVDEPFPDRSGNSAHAWSPSFSIAAYSDHSSVYYRYAQNSRMPSLNDSIFNSTFNIASRDYILAHSSFGQLKPERSTTAEIGLSHDFSRFLENDAILDAKLVYYQIKTKDVIDVIHPVSASFFYSGNLEQQTLKGIELQTRYDSGRFFGSLSANYNLDNTVCDRQQMYKRDTRGTGQISRCVDYGYLFGYLKHSRTPKYSINLFLGTRLWDNRLEMGSRMTYHAKHRTRPSLDEALNSSDAVGIPITWEPAFVADAYVNYRIKKNTVLELSVTNLTDKYYIDPLARTWMPAPGRTIRAGVKIDL